MDGCCMNELEREKKRIDHQINKVLRNDLKNLRKELKLLLLGPGEAGKSTIVKQMELIHEYKGNGFPNEKRKSTIIHIHSNIVESVQLLVSAMRARGGHFQDNRNEALYTQFSDLDPYHLGYLEPLQFDDIASIWQDPGIQAVVPETQRTFHLSDSTEYFMSRLSEIGRTGYLPTDEDVLRVRVRTTSILEYSFNIEKAVFRIIDVGGQRTERRKWIFCFENVTAIFFIASLAEFDQSQQNNSSESRMNESLDLFRVIVNQGADASYFGIWFQKAAMILFLNKTDIFAKKIMTSHLHNYFDDYDGPLRNAEQGQKFILKKFLDQREDSKRSVYEHFTYALDTKRVDFVFNAVRLNVLLAALEDFNPF